MRKEKYYLLEAIYIDGKSMYATVHTSTTIDGVGKKKIELEATGVQSGKLREYIIVKEVGFKISEYDE